MKGLTPRDYVVGGLIIFGVLLAWFIFVATLMGLVIPQLSFSIVIVVGLIIFIVIKRQKLKP